VVFVTHDIEEAVTLSDRVIVLSARPGTIKRDIRVAFARPRELKSLRRAHAFNEICEAIWDALDIERDDHPSA
jgi:NitT/TauT family transport system ATP-binding protein